MQRLTECPSGSPKITIISRSCLIAADALAIGATWHTLGLQFPTRRASVLKHSISSALLTDGVY
ncbi:hypothetical protein BD309DRAFT_697865 [Dichomitus squalens]|nr:hypothetical protein BD309DRAFT_697865 [Dichomitus squalens]